MQSCSAGPHLEKNDWGVNTDHAVKGHCEGEGAGGGCTPSCAEHEAETTSILQREWEAKKSIVAAV